MELGEEAMRYYVATVDSRLSLPLSCHPSFSETDFEHDLPLLPSVQRCAMHEGCVLSERPPKHS